MAIRCELFGHPIINHRQLTYAQQVFEIFVEEIHNGRWQVGKRLPGVAVITQLTGLGNKTIQEAFQKLKDDGYVEAEPYKGTFLKSMLPQGLDSDKGRIGILLSEEQASDPYSLRITHIFMEAFRLRNQVGEVRIVPAGNTTGHAATRRGPFSDKVGSILSLMPFSTGLDFEQPDDAIPTLFFCPMTELGCAPLLAVDVRRAYYELTRRVIAAGHKKIAFVADNGVTPAMTAMYRDSFFRALAESQLEGTEYAAMRHAEAEVADLFRHILAEGETTAVVSGSLTLVQNLFSAAPEMLESVPSRLSVVSIGSDALPGEPGRQVTGMAMNFNYFTQVALDWLQEIAATGRSQKTHLLVAPAFVPGHTLRKLGSARPR